MKVSLKNRICMAWKVLRGQEFDGLIVGPARITDVLREDFAHCDTGYGTIDVCKNYAEVCVSYARASFNVETRDHELVCRSCARKRYGDLKEKKL